MDKGYILIIKGFIIGLGKIIPGVSGALLAISMGIYDKALGVISNFFKDIKYSIKFLMPIGIGILLAIICFSNILSLLLSKYYFVTMLMFLGLIIGGIPSLFKKLYKSKTNKKDYYFVFITIIIVLICYLIMLNNKINLNYIFNYSILYWLIIGAIDALTMIIPGISGTAIFVMLGCYNDIINIYANPFSNVEAILLFMISVAITVLLLTKIIAWLFKNCTKSMYLTIFILLIVSIIALINNIFINPFSLIDLIVGILLFIIGVIIAYILEK